MAYSALKTLLKASGLTALVTAPLSCGGASTQTTNNLSGDKQPLASEAAATPTPEPKSGVINTPVCNTATPTTVATAGPALQVITDKCASCHATQAPVFTTLEAATPIRVSMQQSLDNGTMPPAGSPALTTAEYQALTAWDNGTPATTTLIDEADALLLDATTVYYSTTIADALNTSCNSCHYPGGTSPDTTSYASAKAQAAALLGAVANGTMPPPNSIVPAFDDAAKTALQTWISEGEPLDASTPVATPTPAPTTTCGTIGGS